MFLVDCHAHLDELDDLSEALQEAKTAGVRGIIAVGVEVESNKRILLETDAPVSYQGKEARLKDVRITLKEVVRLKGLDPPVVFEQTTANASRLFQIDFNP
jgi:Tat protein secretion system quality control protein TatD with DNase activity